MTRSTALMYPFPNLEPVCCSITGPKLLILNLHTGFSGGRKSGLIFPSLEEFSNFL